METAISLYATQLVSHTSTQVSNLTASSLYGSCYNCAAESNCSAQVSTYWFDPGVPVWELSQDEEVDVSDSTLSQKGPLYTQVRLVHYAVHQQYWHSTSGFALLIVAWHASQPDTLTRSCALAGH